MLKPLHRPHRESHLWYRWSTRVLAAVVAAEGVVATAARPALADAPSVTAIPQFSGEYHDNFNSYTQGAHGTLTVLSGTCTNRIEGDENSIKIEFSSSLGGDLVVPISGKMMGQLGIIDWEFNQPVKKFGGFWENNSHADDATAEFFDTDGNPLGSLIVPVPVSSQHWGWNGWQFDTPVSRIRVTGNGLINGFIWYDNVEMTTIPEPAGVAACGILCLHLLQRRARNR